MSVRFADEESLNLFVAGFQNFVHRFIAQPSFFPQFVHFFLRLAVVPLDEEHF